jgi:hypothetical protein
VNDAILTLSQAQVLRGPASAACISQKAENKRCEAREAVVDLVVVQQ